MDYYTCGEPRGDGVLPQDGAVGGGSGAVGGCGTAIACGEQQMVAVTTALAVGISTTQLSIIIPQLEGVNIVCGISLRGDWRESFQSGCADGMNDDACATGGDAELSFVPQPVGARKETARKLQRNYKEIAKKLQGNSKEIPRKWQGNCKTGQGNHPRTIYDLQAEKLMW